MEKILLYYHFAPVTDPDLLKTWQKTLGEHLGLRGRILISKHGINGTVGGDIEALKAYIKATRSGYNGFASMKFKWSEGRADDFPRLSIKVKPELVAFEAGDELQVDANGVVGGGVHLKPEAVDKLVAERGGDVTFFDGRNQFEAAIGRFKNAVVPNTSTSRDFIAELESGKYDNLKDKPVVTYCTGGIRCEILTVLMKNRGFKEVYQLDGGIATYGQERGDDGLWEGSMYVFDKRMKVDFSNKTAVLGSCVLCGAATSDFYNCAWPECNQLILACSECAKDELYHTEACRQAAAVAATS